MSYQQSYPQQPSSYQPGYPSAPSRGGNPALAIVAMVLGLAAGASLVVLNIDFFDQLRGAGFGDLPGEMKTVVILRFAGAAVLLVGLIIMMFRKVTGAFVLALGALVAIAAILLYPVLLKDFVPDGLTYGDYLKEIFKFNDTQATFAAIALIASPLAFIDAILPPTLNWLRGGRGDDFTDFAQGPQAEYGQAAQQDYGQQAPQQDYGQYSPPQGFPQQQQPYPQQQTYQQPQQPGYPQQPQQPNW